MKKLLLAAVALMVVLTSIQAFAEGDCGCDGSQKRTRTRTNRPQKAVSPARNEIKEPGAKPGF